MQAIGELPVECERSRNWAGRVRERFDTAMLALRDEGVLAHVAWPGGHGPGDPDRAKGWVSRWLSAKVCITLPIVPGEPTPEESAFQSDEAPWLSVGE